MKFGGTSVGETDCIRRVADIVESHRQAGDEVAVVVSACSGITDQIVAVADEVIKRKEQPPIGTLLSAMRTRHIRLLGEVAPDYIDEVTAVIDDRLTRLQNILTAVHTLKELTPRSRDYIISFGERLSAPIVSAALRQCGISSVVLDGAEAGIVTTANHGDARALPASETSIRSRVAPLLVDAVPVIMGFMGATEQGVITTLGRSGSDYSAAVVGAGIDADEIWIWTDVDGVMTSDPRIVKDARVLDDISYLEVMELSFFGAKVLHPRSVEPAMQKDIPIRVKNSFKPDVPGTLILRDEHQEKRVVKAIALIEKVALVNINGAQMIGRPGVAKTIFSALAEREVNVMMISQGSSEANISLIIDESHLEAAICALTPIVKQGIVREATYDRDVSAVAVVGAGMAGTPGTGGRIFSALGRAGINTMMISQGSSEVNVSFVVKGGDGKRALQVLHDEFRLSENSDDTEDAFASSCQAQPSGLCRAEHTYREAGVDIDLEARAVRALIDSLTYRRTGAFPMLGKVGHFAGLIDCGPYVLALAVDGVGTKMLVADALQDWHTVGIDCIAMNVNDLYVMNLEPVAFVDYIATDALSPEKMARIGEGLNEGARLANMNIVGGETATLKGLVNGLDLAGTCLGVQKKEKVVTGEGIVPGDKIVGVPSSGVHSNGLTLARKVVEDCASYDTRLSNGKTLGEELLTPTRIYHEVLRVTEACTVHGMCHITGGGLLNFQRLTEYGFSVTDPLAVSPIFRWLQETGGISDTEMYRTFNMGMGYAFVAPAESVAAIQSVIPDARVVGVVTEEPGVRLKGVEIQ